MYPKTRVRQEDNDRALLQSHDGFFLIVIDYVMQGESCSWQL